MLTIRHVDGDHVRRLDAEAVRVGLPASGYVWVDLAEPDAAEDAFLDELGIHPLAIEDMREDRHLPKVEAYHMELSLTVHGLAIDEVHEEVRTTELDIAMRPRLLRHDE